MPSLGDSAFLFILALLLFGPKKLPELARQLGKLMGEFRRASNEFRLQMEEELRLSEQAEKQKQIAALEAAATPALPALEAQPNLTSETSENPAQHLHATPASAEALASATTEAALSTEATDAVTPSTVDGQSQVHPAGAYADYPNLEIPPYDPVAEPAAPPSPPPAALEVPVHSAPPIATSGDLNLMPPATGLPTPRTSASITPFVESIPHTESAEPNHTPHPAPTATEESLHG